MPGKTLEQIQKERAALEIDAALHAQPSENVDSNQRAVYVFSPLAELPERKPGSPESIEVLVYLNSHKRFCVGHYSYIIGEWFTDLGRFSPLFIGAWFTLPEVE